MPEPSRKDEFDQQLHLAVVRDLGIAPSDTFRWEPLCFGENGKAERLELSLDFPNVDFIRLIGPNFGRYCDSYRYALACLWWLNDPERPFEVCEFLSESQKRSDFNKGENQLSALQLLVRERWEFIALQATLSSSIFIERFYYLLMQLQFERTCQLIRSADDLYAARGFDARNKDDTRPKLDPACNESELHRVKSLVRPPRIVKWNQDGTLIFQVDSVYSYGIWYSRRELGRDTIELKRNGDVIFHPRHVLSENLNRPYPD